jgi:hypothetical protein
MSDSPGADLGSAPGLEPVAGLGPDRSRGSRALGAVALASAGLAVGLPALGPYIAALFGYSDPMYELLSGLLLGTLILSLAAIALGTAATITKRGASFGLAAILLGGILAVWTIASFVIPAMFGPLS